MAIDRDDNKERQARLDAMIEEFRTARRRRLVKSNTLLRKRAEADEQARSRSSGSLPADHVH